MPREDRILVVEDNRSLSEAIERQFACDWASDGWDAIEKLEERNYAAIVIDADVPRHSGYGVLTWLREEVGAELPNVILMTSASDRDDVRRRAGAEMNIVDKGDAVEAITKVLKS